MARADMMPLTAGMQLRRTVGRLTKSISGRASSPALPDGAFPLAYQAGSFFFHAPFFLAAGGRLDDGSVRVTTALFDDIFPAGIPLISNFNEMYINVNGTLTFDDALPTFTPDAIPGLDHVEVHDRLASEPAQPLVQLVALVLEVQALRLEVGLPVQQREDAAED